MIDWNKVKQSFENMSRPAKYAAVGGTASGLLTMMAHRLLHRKTSSWRKTMAYATGAAGLGAAAGAGTGYVRDKIDPVVQSIVDIVNNANGAITDARTASSEYAKVMRKLGEHADQLGSRLNDTVDKVNKFVDSTGGVVNNIKKTTGPVATVADKANKLLNFPNRSK